MGEEVLMTSREVCRYFGAWAAGQAGTASSRQTPASQREEAVP